MPYSRLFLGLVPWYGVLIAAGMLIALFLADREARRLEFPADTVIDLALRVLPAGIIGARIYYVLFSLPSFLSRPLSILYLWEGGLAIYGGLIAGFVTVLLFCRKRRLSFLRLMDVIVPGVALAQSIGRWGNYFNQEAYGLALDPASPFCFFPLAVQIQRGPDAGWHMAAFFYESVLDFCVFLFLIRARKRLVRKEGDMLLFYLLFYAAGRLVIENLRMDSLYLGSSVRISQLLSVLLCAAVMTVFLQRKRKRQGGLTNLQKTLMIPVYLYGFLTVLFCLRVILPAVQPLQEAVLLTAFSVIYASVSRILYGSSSHSEVLYADHKAA